MMNRRTLLQGLVAGGGASLLLRSLATGLPLSFLLDPSRARADDPPPVRSVLLILNEDGDPFNANCPGSYVEGVTHHPDLVKTEVKLGAHTSHAAPGWKALLEGNPGLGDRMAIIHHATHAVAHNQYPSVLTLQGAAKGEEGNGEECLPTLLAQALFTPGTHIQREPIALAPAPLTSLGNPLPSYDPYSLQQLFSPVSSPGDLAFLTDEGMVEARAKTLDALYAQARASGRPTQKRFLERYATSREEARQLADKLRADLASLPAPDEEGFTYPAQVTAALALLRANVSPVVTLSLPFGGDNHNDAGLGRELEETTLGLGAIALIWQKLHDMQLQDTVTLASLNTFGRSLAMAGLTGRNHNPDHHAMLLIGPRVRGGVYGGPVNDGKRFGAGAFDPATGVVSPGAAIQPGQSLVAAGRTLAAAAGLTSAQLDKRIAGDALVTGALLG
ncbi:MAG: DUF1501 domain-containing protein [Myxococcales bacterium]|nr:MAG: DUF1501 domain-containing protein [Myxococcales bacterium]